VRTTPILSILTALTLVGCPSPPDQQGADGQPAGGPQGAAGPAAGGQQAPPAGDALTDSTGPGPADGMSEELDLDQDMDQTQDQVKEGQHFTVNGKINGDCTGNLRVDVVGIDPPPDEEGNPNVCNHEKDNVDPDGQAVRLLTAATLDNVGNFSLAIPKGEYQMIEIAAHCDANKDGKITGGVDAISGPTDASSLKSDTSGVVLTLSKLPVPVAPEEGDVPKESTGAGDERGHVPSPGEDPNAAMPPDDGSGPPPEGEPAGGPVAGGQPPGPPPAGSPPAGLPEDGSEPPKEGE